MLKCARLVKFEQKIKSVEYQQQSSGMYLIKIVLQENQAVTQQDQTQALIHHQTFVDHVHYKLYVPTVVSSAL